ncbi:MAG TPA: hypothetical protein VEY11_01455 [Pyrinomonadaceae bacterium]|nr:hypothetical protein [Pyrinomonadaceae bacterium]
MSLEKGEDDVNAAGLTFVLGGVSAVLGMPDFQSLIADGSISQDEFEGTRRELSSIITTLKNTPHEKIEALVAQYNEELTSYLDKFNTKTHEHALDSFRNAQIMIGYVTTIMTKSGLRG